MGAGVRQIGGDLGEVIGTETVRFEDPRDPSEIDARVDDMALGRLLSTRRRRDEQEREGDRSCVHGSRPEYEGRR